MSLHLGLSPLYRGSATVFWSFAQGELESVGTRIHLAVAQVDAGQILGRIKPDFLVGDTYYMITNRRIRKSIDALSGVASRYLQGDVAPLTQAPTDERAWRKTDFSEASLHRAFKNIGTGLAAEQIFRIEGSRKCRCAQ